MNALIIQTSVLALILSSQLTAQECYWQQRADYEIQLDFDTDAHRFSGYQEVRYHNNSPDTLQRFFFHLYFNAFQPNSMMDVRSRTIRDPDMRIGNRISLLGQKEIGYHQIKRIRQDGDKLDFHVEGTVLEIKLAKPILPGQTSEIELWYNSQVPVQIRRSGRYNAEGIAYSMSQWYPKVSEYDEDGWHTDPYVAREFYGVWGDFDVYIHIQKDFTVAATGTLQNPQQIGHGYIENANQLVVDDKLSWHFRAENVHDFVWAADPDYTHVTRTRKDGTELHFFYQEGPETVAWEQLPEIVDDAFNFIEPRLGDYPYPQYSIIQGGDGGMEYPMATLVTGHRNLGSLVGVSMHELLHAWYHTVLATHEGLYAWMDEGFTSWADNEVMNYLKDQAWLPGRKPVLHPHLNTIRDYAEFTRSGLEEPLSTHADFFMTNVAYGRAAYTKGEVFLEQVRYIIGEEKFWQLMKRFFNQWKFKHPGPDDFIRLAEKVSGIQLDWFKNYFVYTTAVIDYGIGELKENGKSSLLVLNREARHPMPIDIAVHLENGKIEYWTIPLRMMRGAKKGEMSISYQLAEDWPWTHPTYTLQLPYRMDRIVSVEIDPSLRLADINRDNNVWSRKEGSR